MREAFLLTLSISSPFLFIFVGSRPRESKGTRIIIPILNSEQTDKDHPCCWSAKCNKNYENFVTFNIRSPANCTVAKWRLSVDTRVKLSDGNMGRLYRFQQPDPLYIIFNAWCQGKLLHYIYLVSHVLLCNKILSLLSLTENTIFTFIDDNVHLNDEPSRKEYVLNDAGIIYKGTHKQIYEKPWNYGQVYCIKEIHLSHLEQCNF